MRPVQRYINPEQPTAFWEKLFDLEAIESLLHDSARQGRAICYSEMLDCLGFAFSRPKMRALCVALAEVDRRAMVAGQPELAVLVVRASDKIPGAGWWQGRDKDAYKGAWDGPDALAYITAIQERAFDYWKNRPS